jgi:hypothetical protein
MKSTYSALALASALLLVAVPLMADDLKKTDDKKGTNQAPPEVAAKAKPSANAEAVQQLYLAQSLIEYGRKNKAPEALITAARILGAHGTTEMKEKPTHVKTADAPEAAKNDKKAPDNSPKALLEEAKKLSNNNPSVVALANSVELARGVDPGPQLKFSPLSPRGTEQYRFTFRGGEFAAVTVLGDGDTRLDLYIYDAGGNLVTSHVGPGDKRLATWVPNWTGAYTIQIVNRGTRWNWYTLATN